MRRPGTLGSVALALVAAIGVLFLLLQRPAADVSGATAVSVAIDMDVTGNDARLTNGLTLQSCVSVAGATTRSIDILIPSPGVAAADGIMGYQFTLNYNLAIVNVSAEDNAFLLNARSGSDLRSFPDPTPDAGAYFSAAVDFGTLGIEPAGTSETGPGVVARITLNAVGPGVSALTLSDVILVTANNSEIPIDSITNAQIAVDTPCPTTLPPTIPPSFPPTPPPTPPPTLPPTPTPTPTPTPCLSCTPTPTPTPTPTTPPSPIVDVTVWTFLNDTGQTASDLHARFNWPFLARLVENAPGCPQPVLIRQGFDNTFDLDWGVPCVDTGESVKVELTSEPPAYSRCFYWTLFGEPLTSPSGGGCQWSGDIDCDGGGDSVDAMKNLRNLAGLPVNLPQGCEFHGDVDCNGQVTSLDSLHILRHVVQLPSMLPPYCPTVGSELRP